jgi:endonuclease/exonuclease/phosphatase family metal-dependent hydrolase
LPAGQAVFPGQQSAYVKTMQPAEHGIVVASYNIHRAVGMDGQRNVARIAAVIDLLDADIIALQEVEWGLPVHEAWLERFAERRGYGLIADANIVDHRGHFGNVLLCRYPVTGFDRIDLAVGRFEPRAAISARVDILGAEFHLLATHLGLRKRERREQSSRIAAVLAPREREPAILLGDLNDWQWRSRSIRPATVLFQKAPSPRSFPARQPLFALDRILFRGIADHPRVRAVVHPLTRMASDHLPVAARFRVPTGDRA